MPPADPDAIQTLDYASTPMRNQPHVPHAYIYMIGALWCAMFITGAAYPRTTAPLIEKDYCALAFAGIRWAGSLIAAQCVFYNAIRRKLSTWVFVTAAAGLALNLFCHVTQSCGPPTVRF